MLSREEASAVLHAALSDESTGRVVPPNTDPCATEADLLAHLCQPFEVRANVMAPGFPFASAGEILSGLCIAHSEGYWLVYQPEANRFLCFWGSSLESLGAHGVYGGPLYCWAA